MKKIVEKLQIRKKNGASDLWDHGKDNVDHEESPAEDIYQTINLPVEKPSLEETLEAFEKLKVYLNHMEITEH